MGHVSKYCKQWAIQHSLPHSIHPPSQNKALFVLSKLHPTYVCVGLIELKSATVRVNLS